MTRAWILQSNPHLYDIDSALHSLDRIDWRVPQHTSEVQPGDITVIWRSGPDAGIIGLGRILTPPRAMTAGEDDRRFVRGDGEGRAGTLATVRVAPVHFIPKPEVAGIPAMAGHPVITAPMGTVFPLSPEQWSELAARLPEPPAMTSESIATFPIAFAWNDRRKAVHPLLGGVDAYLDTLNDILRYVGETQPEPRQLDAHVSDRFDVSNVRASHVMDYLERVSLLRSAGNRVELTAEGRRWLQEQDPLFLLALVHSRIQFIGEFLEVLEAPKTINEVLETANRRYDMRWTTRAQVDRRRHFLEAVGAVRQGDDRRLYLTEFGRRAFRTLDAHQRSEDVTAAPPAPPAPPQTIAEPETVADAAEVSYADLVVARLESAAADATRPEAFERAIADAFAFLGFTAVSLGGAGKTDVLLTADLGPEEGFRVIIDAKTTSHDAVRDQQIDWDTLDEHKEKYEADYVVLVAPAFGGQRLEKRARKGRHVVLLDVSVLSSLVLQHSRAPLGLDVYRLIFESPSATADIEAITEAANEHRRATVLASEIVRIVERLQEHEGAVTPRDVYWNLTDFQQQFDRPTMDEIEEALTALSSPAVGVLRRIEGGYTSLGSRQTALRRLRLLADLIEHGAPEA